MGTATYIPNDTSSERSRRDVSNAVLRRRRYFNCRDIEHGKSAQGYVMCTVVRIRYLRTWCDVHMIDYVLVLIVRIFFFLVPGTVEYTHFKTSP